MGSKSLLLSFILISFTAFSQNNVTITASKSSMGEFESVDIVASVAAPADKDIVIDFNYSGTAMQESDFTFNFPSKGLVTTVAGGNELGGSASNQLNLPVGVFVDLAGNVYVCDGMNHRVQKWEPGATVGYTVAGGNGVGTAPNQLAYPSGIFVDLNGNIYIADENNRVQKWAPGATEGITVAGGNGAGNMLNQLNKPKGVFVDLSGNLYVSDTYNERVQMWIPGSLEGITVAGGHGRGFAQNQFYFPTDVSVDLNGNMYIVDSQNHRIQKWSPGASEGITVAGGNGDGSNSTKLSSPLAVQVVLNEDIYIADRGNSRIQKWAKNALSGITVVGGTWAPYAPFDVFVDLLGNIYTAETYINRVQKYQKGPQIIIKAGQTSGSLTISGISDELNELDETVILTPVKVLNGNLTNHESIPITITNTRRVSFTFSAPALSENAPDDVILTATVDEISETDIEILFTTEGIAIENLEYILSSNTITIPAGSNSGTLTISTRGLDDNASEYRESIILKVNTITNATAVSNTATLYITSDDSPSVTIGAASSFNENARLDIVATLSGPNERDIVIELDLSGTAIYESDYTTQFLSKGARTTVAGGNGSGSNSNQIRPRAVCVDLNGNVFVADQANNRVQKWVPGATTGITVAGGNGAGQDANQLNGPTGVFVDESGNIYVSDELNHRVQKWAPGAVTGTTVAGGNGAGFGLNQLSNPMGIFVDLAGNLYVTDKNNHRIQLWAPQSTTGITVAGGNGFGSYDHQLKYPQDVVVDLSSKIFIADYSNNRVVIWAPGATSGITIPYITSPTGVSLDIAGNIYVATNHTIKKWPSARPITGEYIGNVITGSSYSGSEPYLLNKPSDIFIDSRGNLFIADTENYRVQKLQLSQQIVVKAGQTTGKLTLIGIYDNLDKEDKTIIVTPVKVTNGSIEDYSSKTIILKDDDPTPIITFELSATKTTENAYNNITLTARSYELSGKDIKIDFIITGTAQETTEYLLSSKTIIIPAGRDYGTLTISTKGLDDNLVEPNESIEFNIDTITNATTEATLITLLIESDDLPHVVLEASSTTIAEHQGLDIVATIESPSSKDVIIDLIFSGTAHSDHDYVTEFPTKGSITTIGKGQGSGSSQFNWPSGVFVDMQGNLFVADAHNSRIQKWTPGAISGTTIIGNYGYGSAANQINFPKDVFVDLAGNIFIADQGNQRIQKWAPGAFQGVTVAGGNGEGSNENQLSRPEGIFVDLAGNIYIAEELNHRIQKWSPGATKGITVAGGNGEGFDANQLNNPYSVTVDKAGAIYITDQENSRIQKWLPGATSGITYAGGDGSMSWPAGITINEAGDIYMTDIFLNRVQKFMPGAPEGITVGGGSAGQEPNQLYYPMDVCLDKAGNVYVADQINHRVQKYLYAPQIVIKAGETTGKLHIKAIQDEFNNEGNESIIINSTLITNAIADAIISLNITILDNTTTLTLKENPFTGLSNGAVSWGDFDRDGDQDVAVMGQSPTEGVITAVYENREGSFINTSQNFEKLYNGDISWVDVNKDGWIDLVVSGLNDVPKTKLYLNMQGKSFSPTDDYGLPQLFDSKMAWGDLDNDGDIDLAMYGINSNEEFKFYVYYREQNPDKFIIDEHFINQGLNWPELINGEIKIEDIDLDGDNDVVYNGETSSKFPYGGMFLNTYKENSDKYYNNEYLWLTNSTIEVARFSADQNDLTIITSGEDFYGNFKLSSNKELVFISQEGTIIDGPQLINGDISVADYNSDGLNDIIFTGENKVGLPVTTLFFQDKYGRFKESDIQLKGLRKSTADWVDYDMDGDLDLFLTGEDATGAKTLLYESVTANQVNLPPSIISGLTTEHLGNGMMRFSWDKPSDDFSSNLGYVIRIGTTPGGSELSNTESDLQTGRRLITKPASIYTNFYETQLDPGNYYWSVQAVDPGLKAGMFSNENTFTLTYEWKILNQGGIIDKRIAGIKDPVIKLSDIDNDNDMDMIYGSSNSGHIKLIKYNGKRLYETYDTNFSFLEKFSDAEVGDLNGDGTADILINSALYNGTYNLLLYMSNGSGQYNQFNVGNGLYKSKSRIIDLNNDGQAEIVLLGLSSSLSSGKIKMIIYEFNKSSGLFSSNDISNQIASLTNASFDLGDIDNDQDIDLILSGYNLTTGYQCYLYENATVPGGSYKLTSIGNNLVAVIDGTNDLIDVDGDGDLDVVISGTSNAGDVFEIYENEISNGIPAFTRLEQQGLTPMREGKIDLGDFNADGYSDLLYSGTVSGIGKMTGLSEFNPLDNSFIKSAFDVSDIINAEVEFGDFEGDGDLDFAISGESSKTQGVYVFRAYINVRTESAEVLASDRSEEFAINEPPSAPKPIDFQLLKVQEDGKILTEFSWQASTDDHTPVEGLTYAIKVGKTSGGNEIMSANANVNGTRQTTQKGNTEHNLKWHLALPNGIYYWSVQAIDASYSGSEFTTPQKITVSQGTVGIDELKVENQIAFYPNPTSGLFSIIVPGSENEVKIGVRTVTGSILSESFMQVPSNRILNMDMTNFISGVYMVSIQSDKLNHVIKIVKN